MGGAKTGAEATGGAGGAAPRQIDIDNDGLLKNRVYVHGATGDGSGWFQDDASVGTYGRLETYIEAPPSDSAAQAGLIAPPHLGRGHELGGRPGRRGWQPHSVLSQRGGF